MTLFLSYSSKDTQYASELDESCMTYGVNVIRDDRDLKPYENIISFMDQIKSKDFAIMLLSENYLKSKYCIYEFSEFMKKDDFHEKVLPIMLPNFQLNNETFELLKRYHAPLSQRYSRNLIARFLIKFFTKKSEQEVQFDSLWKYLTETKLLSYQKLKDEKYKDLYSHIGIYDEDIWNAILKVREIADEQDREIEFAKIQRKHPGSYIVNLNAGIISHFHKKYKKAIFYYNEFLAKFTDDTYQVHGFFHLGQCHYDMGNFDDCIECHSKGVNIWPHISWRSYQGLGDAYYMGKGDIEKAIKCYKLANEIVKESYVCRNLGIIESKRKNYKEAISYLLESINLKPDQPDLWFALKICYQQIGEPNNAEETLIKAYNLFPNDYKIATDYVSLLYKKDENDEIDLHLCETILTKSFKAKDDYIPTRALLAQTLILMNKNRKSLNFAIELLRKTLKMEMGENRAFYKEYCLQLLSDAEDIKNSND